MQRKKVVSKLEEYWNYNSTNAIENKELSMFEGENVHTCNLSNQSTSELIQQHKITKKIAYCPVE